MSRSSLIVLAIVFTLVAFVAADVDFWRTHAGHATIHRHVDTLFTSYAIASRGEIELDEEHGRVAAMSPDAYLEIRERRLTTRRRLEVRPDADGRPAYLLRVGSRRRSEREAKEFLAANMDEILTSTTIGAVARARRLASEGGAERVLGEIARLESNSLRRVYLEEAARANDLDPELAARIVRTAGREITSSSQLRRTLVALAESLPSDWELTGELLGSAEAIGSSSELAGTVVEIVRARSVAPEDIAVLGDAVSSISSSAEKASAIHRLLEIEPSADMVEAMLAAAATIDSSSEKRRALAELVAVPELPADLYLSALGAAEEIASSAEKATFLVGCATVLPPRADLEDRYVEVASSIPSSTEQARALSTLMERRTLTAPLCVGWIRSAAEVASSSVTGDLLVQAAGSCPVEASVRAAYLEAVEGVASSAEQRRALLALIARGGLGVEGRRQVAAVVERSLASSRDRAAVLEELAESAPATDSASP